MFAENSCKLMAIFFVLFFPPDACVRLCSLKHVIKILKLKHLIFAVKLFRV